MRAICRSKMHSALLFYGWRRQHVFTVNSQLNGKRSASEKIIAQLVCSYMSCSSVSIDTLRGQTDHRFIGASVYLFFLTKVCCPQSPILQAADCPHFAPSSFFTFTPKEGHDDLLRNPNNNGGIKTPQQQVFYNS